ncbi:MAG: class II aldolase/adducin family protein [Bacteroidota bacterium]
MNNSNLPIDGYIKFNCVLEKSNSAIPELFYTQLEKFRRILYDHKLIGVYDCGIGYGNISMRIENTDKFIITGSATGSFQDLDIAQYVRVDKVEVETNTVYCSGEINASSETMSHAVVYKSNARINAVVHVHNKQMWEKYLNVLPSTTIESAYGTPEIAKEISDLVINERGILITGGHEEGIITYSADIEDATNLVLKYLK